MADKDELIKQIADTLRKEIAIDAPPQRVVRSTGFKKTRSRPKSDEEYSIKVLFTVREGATWSLYIGGDRATPLKIYSGLRTEPTRSRTYLSNLGLKLNDWVVGFFNNESRITNIFGNDSNVYTHTNTDLASTQYTWLGTGNWAAYLEGKAVRGAITETYSTFGRLGEITTQTASYSSNNVLLQCQGTYNQTVEQNDYNSADYSIRRTTITIDYKLQNTSYSFYKKTIIKRGNYSFYSKVVDTSAGSSAGVINGIARNDSEEKIKPIFIGNDGFTIDYKLIDISSETPRTRGYLDIFSQKEETNINSLIIGCNNSIVHLEQNTSTRYESSDGSSRTAPSRVVTNKVIVSQMSADNSTIVNTLASYAYEDTNTSISSINPRFGATLVKNNFYLVAPSIDKDVIESDIMEGAYGSGLWVKKRFRDYREFNIYDKTNPEKTTKDVLVWVAKILNNGLVVKEDKKVTVLGLLPNAKVLVASYYTKKNGA